MTTPKVPSTTKPERSLNRQVVLEEDEYTAALSQIIARDFFPSLVQLDATNDYLDALHSRDPHLINASVRRLEELSATPAASTSYRGLHQTPSQTPYAAGPYDTPLRTPRGERVPPQKRTRYDTDMNLDNFQARYTSEDNSSFTHILDEENRKRKERWDWAWDAQRRVEQQKGKMLEARERMLIEPAQPTGVRGKFAIEAPKPVGLITGESSREAASEQRDDDVEGGGIEGDKGKGKEVIRSSDVEQSAEDVMAPLKDTRSAVIDGWNFKTRNSLMFPPDADESPYHPSSVVKDTSDPRVIKYGNTRLPEHSEPSSSRSSEPPSPTRSRIDAAITGTPYRPRSPTINNFSLVPNLPSPTPAELGPAAVKQLMTWGTLNATPRVISGSDDVILPPSQTPFHLPKISSREAISNKLASSASKSLRVKANLLGLGPSSKTPRMTKTPSSGRNAGNMAPPSWTPRKTEGNLTPAAKRLLERSTLGSAAARRAEAMERTAGWDNGKSGERDLNRVRWTPTPTSTR